MLSSCLLFDLPHPKCLAIVPSIISLSLCHQQCIENGIVELGAFGIDCFHLATHSYSLAVSLHAHVSVLHTFVNL